MQFQVPQFIETEDKIVGPLTLRQFIYLAIAALLVFLSFFILQTWLWVVVVVVLGGASTALAFIQINGRPMLVFAMNAFIYLWEPHLYTYSEEFEVVVSIAQAPVIRPQAPVFTPPHPEPEEQPAASAQELRRSESAPTATEVKLPSAEAVPAEEPEIEAVPIIQEKPVTEEKIPVVSAPETPAIRVTPKPAHKPAVAAASTGLKDLWSKLQTTKNAIPHREKPLAGEIKDQDEIQEKYEVIRKITGESQLAKRVDYK